MNDTYIEQEEFLRKYGHITLEKFCDALWMPSIASSMDETVQNYIEKISPGCVYINAFSNEKLDSLQHLVIVRKHENILNILTKLDGINRSWLEIGVMERNGVWIKDEKRYPYKDERLHIERKRKRNAMPRQEGSYLTFDQTYVKWDIKVALDYPLAIRLVARGAATQRETYEKEIVDTTPKMIWTPETQR